MSRGEYAWLKKYLKQLEGKKIVRTSVDSEGFPTIELDDGTEIQVLRDEEGNGPGFLSGLPTVAS